MTSKRVHYQRDFLNTEEAGGHAFVEAEISEWREGGSVETTRHVVDAYFNVADCNRQISIDCCVYSPEGVKNVRQKIQRLRSALIAFEAAWEVRVAMMKPEKPEIQPEPAAT